MSLLHCSVLKDEAISSLNIKEDGIYVDATVGYAGHSKEILARCPKGFLYGFDADEEALNYAKEKLSKVGSNFKLIHDNFLSMMGYLPDVKVDGILFDLGFSSPQIDDEKRGFSFMKTGPLDMRMDRDKEITAEDIVNNYSEDKLKKVFYEYGEEKLSSKIAGEIVRKRDEKKIATTTELTDVIQKATGANYFYKHHPERKIFQALRIEVNKELEVLEEVLPKAIDMLNVGGRICVITFHSLEDKIVKKIFKKYSEVNDLVKGMPDIPEEYKPLIKVITHKPILPSNKELQENTRSHSAKLRVIERI